MELLANPVMDGIQWFSLDCRKVLIRKNEIGKCRVLS